MPSNAKCRPHASYTICTEARYLRGLGPIYQESPPIIGVWAERSALGLVIGLRCGSLSGGEGYRMTVRSDRPQPGSRGKAGKVNTGRAARQVRARTGSRLVGCRLSGRARNALTSEPVLLVTLACRQVAGAACALRAPGLRLPRSCSRAGPLGAWCGSLPDCRSCFAVLWIAAPAIPPRRMPVLPSSRQFFLQ